MPEVGVLNLTIQDNSTEAAGGLSELTGALVGLQNALGQGLKLSGVSKPLNTFANAVKENSKTFANVGSFLNAMSTYKKAFDEADKVRFNAQPIRDLKDAIGDGIRLGQAGTQIKNIREALTGEWNTDNAYKAGQALAAIGEGAKSIPSGLEKKADGISKVAAALQEYADASERIKSVVGSGPASALNDSMGKMSIGGRSFGLQFFGGTGGGDNAINEMHSYAETIHSAADEAKDFNVQLHETKDVVESIRVNPFEDMYQSFSRMAHEFDWFKKESMRLMSGDSPLLLGDGRTPGQLLLGDGSEPQTFLSVWRDTGEQWKQNWVEFSSDAANEMRSQWKPDWIVGEGTVSAAKEVVNEIKEGAQATQAMATAARDYNSEIGKVHNYFKNMSLEDIYNGTRENAMGKRSLMSEWLHGEGTETEQAYAIKQVALQLGMSVDEVKKQIDIWNGVTANINTIDLSQYMDMSQTDLLTMKMQGMEDALMRDVQAGKLDQQQIAERAMAIQNLRDKIQELTDAQNEASGGTVTFGGALKSLQAGVNAMFPTLTSMIKRLGTIAKYRFIRSVIKHITSGFSEGIQNVYEYSKAVSGSFAPAMDSAATSIAQMKNSLGAALAPAIQALIPILNTVVNWFITLVNYANQFFALLNGQATWTRALPATVNAFDKQKKAAKGAGSAIKDLLADWDELNIIQSEAGGGGGVGSAKTAEDYLKM
ncbi:MAG TPA: hypothetical protein DHV79_07930, partial [Lachnospiraceae bacterium]|nr:hypothetical protein [Lachnospiraceae bacterium]